MNNKRIHGLLCTIENRFSDRLGFISNQWLGRAIRGFAPQEEKAPWWNKLEGEPAANVISEMRESIKKDQKSLDEALSIIEEIMGELDIEKTKVESQ